VESNSADRLSIILAFQMGHITVREMEMELRRLDTVLSRIYAEWSADHRLVVPILDEDLICANIHVIGKNQYN